jgi:hypothetical protein
MKDAKPGGNPPRLGSPGRNPSGPVGSTKACGSGHERLLSITQGKDLDLAQYPLKK